MREFLEGMAEGEDAGVGVGSADEGEADGEGVDEAEGDGEMSVTGDGGGSAGDTFVGVAMGEIDAADGIVGGEDEGVELVRLQGGVDAFGSGEAAGVFAGGGTGGDDLRGAELF